MDVLPQLMKTPVHSQLDLIVTRRETALSDTKVYVGKLKVVISILGCFQNVHVVFGMGYPGASSQAVRKRRGDMAYVSCASLRTRRENEGALVFNFPTEISHVLANLSPILVKKYDICIQNKTHHQVLIC